MYIEACHLALWLRKIGTANKSIHCIENMWGLEVYITTMQTKWLIKAKKLVKWLLLSENRELRRSAYPNERQTQEYHKWRTAVLARDLWACQDCGAKENLATHHIKSYKGHANLRIDVNNGITLCREHHKKRH